MAAAEIECNEGCWMAVDVKAGADIKARPSVIGWYVHVKVPSESVNVRVGGNELSALQLSSQVHGFA